MPWLLRDDEVLASIEVADTARARMKGLLGRDGIDGAMLIRPSMSVHTLGMRFAVDVAFLDGELRVLAVKRMRPWRISAARLRSRAVLEAEAGAFERWKLAVGDVLEVR